LSLGPLERLGNKLTSKGHVKTYSVERVKVELPVNNYNASMPIGFVRDIENLAIRNQQHIKMSIKKFLPTKLENVLSKIVVQTQQLSEVYLQVKFITLRRFIGSKVDEN